MNIKIWSIPLTRIDQNVIMADEKGFEPLDRLMPAKCLAGTRIRPLCHSSIYKPKVRKLITCSARQ